MAPTYVFRQAVSPLAAGALAAFLPAVAAAQAPVTSFDEIGTRLKAGEKIRVIDASGGDVRGRVVSIQSAALVLMVEGISRELRDTDIRQVDRYYRDSGWQGTLLGAGIGAAGLWAVTYAGDSEMATDPEAAPSVLVLGAAGGALVGYIIDRCHLSRRTVYLRGRAGGASPSLKVAPLIASRHRGVAVAISF